MRLSTYYYTIVDSYLFNELCCRPCHLLPGRIPGYKRFDIQLLPTCMTKKSVYSDYVKARATLTFGLASYRSFCRIWQKFVPGIVITKPKSDLCWQCQQNSEKITNSSNKSDEEKVQVSHSIALIFNLNVSKTFITL